MLTIVIAGAALVSAYAAYKGLKAPGGNPMPTNISQDQVQTGANTLAAVGQQAQQVTSALQDQSTAQKDTAVKSAIATTGGATTVGIQVAGASGAAAGATAAAVTFGIGIAIGLAVILWGKHEARIKGAKTENAGWNAIAAAFKSTITGVVGAYNAGQLTVAQAVAELNSLRDLVLRDGLSFNHIPGVNWSRGTTTGTTSQKYNSVKCDKHCTVGCCLYNNIVGPAINNAVAMLQGQPLYVSGAATAPTISNTMTVPEMKASKYGFQAVSSFTLTKGR